MASPENIRRVAEIVQKQSETKTTTAVFSAFGGVTNELLQMAELAANEDLSYKDLLDKNEKRHLTAVKTLIPVKDQSSILSKVKNEFNRLETLYEGVYLLNELSNRTRHVIAGFGEILSSLIITEYLRSQGEKVQYTDSRDLIVCKNVNEKIQVNYEKTYQNIKDFFAEHKAKIFVAPGFVARNEQGIPSTLGRGGSDFTAALFAGALNVERLTVYTDVDGMYTANPNVVQ